jgi:hypothetical protein
MIASIVTLLTAQIALITDGVVSVLGVVLPVAVGLMLFYFGWRKIRGAIN